MTGTAEVKKASTTDDAGQIQLVDSWIAASKARDANLVIPDQA